MQGILDHKLLVYGMLFAVGFVIVCKALSYKFMFQITPSLPKGIYLISAPKHIESGTLVVFHIPKNIRGLMHARGWLLPRLKFYLMKPVVAKQGDSVEVSEAGVFINGRFFGPVKQFDSQGLPLPKAYLKRTLQQGEYFVATTYPNSFDSRYFGTIHQQDIKWVARPFLVSHGD
jgi:conjugative transfer signal peptidase TraF